MSGFLAMVTWSHWMIMSHKMLQPFPGGVHTISHFFSVDQSGNINCRAFPCTLSVPVIVIIYYLVLGSQIFLHDFIAHDLGNLATLNCTNSWSSWKDVFNLIFSEKDA